MLSNQCNKGDFSITLVRNAAVTLTGPWPPNLQSSRLTGGPLPGRNRPHPRSASEPWNLDCTPTGWSEGSKVRLPWSKKVPARRLAIHPQRMRRTIQRRESPDWESPGTGARGIRSSQNSHVQRVPARGRARRPSSSSIVPQCQRAGAVPRLA
jgi:hypothetical protein